MTLTFHAPGLLATIVISLAIAYLFGMAVRAIRLPPVVGYLIAGVAVGPFTPGFVVDPHIVTELADIGVALLLFGVGLHFSLADLLSVWRIAVPGALVQIAGATAIGFTVGRWMLRWTPAGSLLLGIGLAIASTAVATRTLEDRGELSTETGRVALGWLVVQDLAVVVVLVLLPPATLAADHAGSLLPLLARTALELAGFVVVVVVAGQRLIPWMLALTARAGSRDLFTLAVILVALGVAYGSAQLFGVSLGLGAFFAGVVLAESDLRHQAAAASSSVQQVFAVLFFVSVGLSIDPAIMLHVPLEIGAILLAILVGIGFVALCVQLALRVPVRAAAKVAAALAQIGEFSFILAAEAVADRAMPAEGLSLVLSGALLAILVNPFVFRANEKLATRLEQIRLLQYWTARPLGSAAGPTPPPLTDHALVIGHGRVGSVVVAALREHHVPFLVIEQDHGIAERSRRAGLPVIFGDGTRPEVIAAGRPERAKLVVVAIPDRFLARRIIDLVRHANRAIDVVVRTHSDEEAEWLDAKEVGLVVMSERETALGIAEYALRQFAVDPVLARNTLKNLRRARPRE
jgi:monovalent cation:H+ antiporter-2, CPA2 family